MIIFTNHCRAIKHNGNSKIKAPFLNTVWLTVSMLYSSRLQLIMYRRGALHSAAVVDYMFIFSKLMLLSELNFCQNDFKSGHLLNQKSNDTSTELKGLCMRREIKSFQQNCFLYLHPPGECMCISLCLYCGLKVNIKSPLW